MTRRLVLAPLAASLVCCFMNGSDAVDAGSAPEAGSTDGGASAPASWEQRVMHRLTRVEYANTVRDLLGEPMDASLGVAAALPDDQQNALGYDEDGAALVTSPLLVEAYFDVAGQLAANLFGRLHPYTQPFTIVSEPNFGVPCTGLSFGQICGNDAGAWYNGDPTTGFWGIRPSLPSTPNDLVGDGITIALDNTYVLSVTAFATPDTGCATGTCIVKVDVALDTAETQFDITTVPPSAPQTFTFGTRLLPGTHSLRLSSVYMYDTKNPYATYDRTAWVGNIHLDVTPAPSTGVQARDVLDCGAAETSSATCTSNILTKLLPRAWRRPVTPGELAEMSAIAASVPDWQTGMQLAIQAALTSPYFVYRPEIDPSPSSSAPHPLGDYELASRLSYFLWSSMPDDELFAKAAAGTLHQPAVLDAEVERMLADPRATALASDFAGQWLMTRTLPTVAPSTTLYPQWSADVQAAMGTETQLFFLDFLAPGRLFPSMFNANYTYVNPTLAAFYGLPNLRGAGFAAVSLAGSHRSGLLSQGSILAVTSQPTRTSPVERGKFVLGRLLCSEPPPPPANVPPFNIDPTAGSVRQRLDQHVKAGVACSGCHDLLDPIGLALENFDAVGRYRTMDGAFPVDTTGLVYNGHAISDVTSLSAVVTSDPRFVDCVSQQFFSYAMGQEAGPADAPTVSQLEAAGPSFRAMIHAAVESAPFTTRAGGS